jgi:hypothetical protein
VWECMCRLLRPSVAVRDELLAHVKKSWPGCKCTKLPQLATQAFARHALAVFAAWGMMQHVHQALDDTCVLMKGVCGGHWRQALRQRRTLGTQAAVEARMVATQDFGYDEHACSDGHLAKQRGLTVQQCRLTHSHVKEGACNSSACDGRLVV